MVYTREELITQSREIWGNEYDYSMLEDVKYTRHGKMNVICRKHGLFVPEVRFHLAKGGCRQCYHDRQRGKLLKNKQYYVVLGNKLHNNFYNYDKYIYNGAYVKGIITCPIHGDFEQPMNCHTNKSHPHGCYECGLTKQSKRFRKTQEKYITECREEHGNTYILDDIIYTEAHGKITPICRKHGKWETDAHTFLKGSGCPICKESQGEKLVAKMLDNMGIVYERQKRYLDCRGKKYTLPFDFYLPVCNTLIEYDGEQHTKPVRFYNVKKAIDKLHEVQWRDSIKTEYCKSNGIPLVRINYTMSENEILEKIQQIGA